MTPDANQKKVQCRVCGHLNRPGILLCENCGHMLQSTHQSRSGTRNLRDATKQLDAERQRIELEEDNQNRVRGMAYREGMGIRLEIEGADKPIILPASSIQQDQIIGRKDPITEKRPAVDLDAYAGYRLGVSRNHAVLRYANQQLLIVDLGSANGTFLNGTQLPANQPSVLLNDDLLRLGQVTIHVRFQDVSETK